MDNYFKGLEEWESRFLYSSKPSRLMTFLALVPYLQVVGLPMHLSSFVQYYLSYVGAYSELVVLCHTYDSRTSLDREVQGVLLASFS